MSVAAVVTSVGEAVIDLIEDGKGNFSPHTGGSPYNFAIGVARQGVPVSYVSPFSEDAFGDKLHATLQAEGVQTPLQRRSRHPTSLSLISVDDAGVPAYQVYRQGVADKDVTLEEILTHVPADLKVLHTGSLAITPSQLPRMRGLLARMRERGVVVSMDINVRISGSPDKQSYIEGVRSMFPLADIVKASAEDLQALDLADDDFARAETAHREMGSGMLVFTKGERGARLYCGAARIDQQAMHAGPTIDTVGAGDAYIAAFIAWLIREDNLRLPVESISPAHLRGALRYASVAAAINVTRAGCAPPSQTEVEDLLRNAVEEIS